MYQLVSQIPVQVVEVADGRMSPETAGGIVLATFFLILLSVALLQLRGRGGSGEK